MVLFRRPQQIADPEVTTDQNGSSVYMVAKNIAHILPPIGRAARPYWARTESRLLRLRGIRAVHFLHIGKTGGNSVRHALDGVRSDRYAIRKWGHGFHLIHVPEGDKFFFFVRDPLSRFTSAFAYRYGGGTQLNPDPWTGAERSALERFPTPRALGEALSAGGETQTAAENAMRSIEHVRDHLWDWFGDPEYFLTRRRDLFFAGRQENLTEDFAELASRLGMENRTMPTDNVNTNRTPQGVSRELSSLAQDNLKHWYASDYHFLQFLEDHDILPS